MDFSYLLELAKDNDKNNKQEAAVSRFSTKLSRPKKVDRPGPKVAAVHAVLERMEKEKQKENEEARKKKENLLALRAQDRKSKKRVKAMINMSKGASKAVLDDAKDLTTAKGEEQCDEDDYGYESTMSQTIFSKLANQYANTPEDERLKFIKKADKRSIDEIKSRVINTLKKEEEEEQGPRKRKRRQKSNGEFEDFINDGDEYDGAPSTSEKSEKPEKSKSSKEKVVNVNITNYKSDKYNNFKYERDREGKDKRSEKEEEKPKKKHKHKHKTNAPPPMSFEELLRVAQTKQKEPIPDLIEEKKVKDREKKKEIERPLTAKEKEELEDERRRKLKRMGKLPPEKKKPEKDDTKTSPGDNAGKSKKNGENKQSKNNGESVQKPGKSSKLREQLESPKPEPKTTDKSKYFAVPFNQKQSAPPQAKESKPQVSKPPQPKPESKFAKPETPKSTKPPKPREIPTKDVTPKKPSKFPGNDRGRQFPPSDVRRKPPVNLPPAKRRIESDSEEEYDSEMDDFIDDGDEELDYRSEISKMFGYDRSRFKDDDDDCDDMEASFSQLQKEERYSAKIGLQEDLEDIRREEEEKKRKMMRLKQLKKQQAKR